MRQPAMMELSAPTEIDEEPTAPIDRSAARSERMDQALDAAYEAIATLRALERVPSAPPREAVLGAVGDMARTLAKVRRCVRALSAELGALESESRELVVAVFEQRRRRVAEGRR